MKSKTQARLVSELSSSDRRYGRQSTVAVQDRTLAQAAQSAVVSPFSNADACAIGVQGDSKKRRQASSLSLRNSNLV